jgi:hypothetical protein
MRTILCALLALLALTSLTTKAADVLTPGFLKISLYTNIPGTAVSALTADPRYPFEPNEVRYLRSFNTRDALPNDAVENFGGRIEGFITPLVTGDYHFFLRSDDSSELLLSTDDTEGSAVLIAQETGCCGLFAEPGTDPATTAVPIPLVAGQRYFIMVLYKTGGGAGGQSTDMAQVAWRLDDPAIIPPPASALQPIPGAFLSTLASDAQSPTITITQQPASLTAEESARVRFSVAATTTPTNRVIQWQRNGENIPGATGTNYSFFATKADHNATFRAVVSVPGAFVESSEAVLTVSPDDARPPTIVAARGGPNRPEVTLTFSEPVSDILGVTLENYSINSAAGPLTVTSAVLSQDGSQVLLTTDPQTPGTVYTVLVNNVTDRALAPNTIAPNSEITFTARGPWLQGEDGFVVFEAEDYDRNVDGRWLPDTTRGTPSGGISMFIPNGISGQSEGTTRLEYDILFTKTGTNILWWRSTGNDGNDDSAVLLVDGQRPPERPGDQAGMGTGSGLTADFNWRSDALQGLDPMTFVIETPGVHTITVARREDGAFFDKFLLTIDPTFNPTTLFGQQGPPRTLREGEVPPSGTSLEITLQPTNVVTVELTNVTLRAGVTTVPAASLVGYQWQRKQGDTFVDIPGATTANFTINRVGLDWNGAVVRMRASSSGITRFTDEAQITVNRDVTGPSLLAASGLAVPQQVILRFSEPLNTNTVFDPFAYEIQGPAGRIFVNTVTLLANERTVVLTTDPQTIGAKYTVTVAGIFDQAATSNLIVNAVARFYSLGPLREQGPDGLIVFEAENFDRNTDGRWRTDSVWGNPSGGLSVVLPNGGGGNEASSKLEYDLNFTQTGTHYVWYRASAPSGTDDSAWLHLDGARPPNRTAANQAAMQVVNGTDFVWETDPQDGERPYTIEITTPGVHTIAVAVREDGAYFDKFAIANNTNFNPNSLGAFGPGETREGAVPPATLAISSPADNQTFPAGANVPLGVSITDNGRVISKVEYFAGTQKIGESTTGQFFSFNWQNVPEGVYAITAQLTDDVGDTARAARVVITVGNPNDVLFLAATSTLGAGDLGIRDRIAALGFNVVAMDDDLSTELDGLGKKLIVVSSTVNSGSIAAKFRNATSPVLTWEQANQDDFGMTGNVDNTDRGTVTAQTQVEIVSPDHPMGAGLPVGVATVTTAPTDFSWGLPNENAVRIATLVGNPNRVVLYGYDTGASMVGGFVAPARRVMLFLTDNTYGVLHEDGLRLFDAALNWALGGVTPPAIHLTVTRGPGGLTLQWTGGTGPYKVQKKNALTDASWTDVTTTSQTSHTVAIEGQSGFFRIVQE